MSYAIIKIFEPNIVTIKDVSSNNVKSLKIRKYASFCKEMIPTIDNTNNQKLIGD